MATETLGAHLRNLLTPYSTLIDVIENSDTEYMKIILNDCKENLINIINFSNSEKMEKVLWRKENE